MSPLYQVLITILGVLLTVIFTMIAVNLQRISTAMKEMNTKINEMTVEFAQSKERVSSITTGCNARHIEVNEMLQDHELRIRTNELKLAHLKG
jgi:hypothetical protein